VSGDKGGVGAKGLEVMRERVTEFPHESTRGRSSCETLLRLPACRTFPWCGGVILSRQDTGPALFELDQCGP
jgi:hypothetical protein